MSEDAVKDDDSGFPPYSKTVCLVITSAKEVMYSLAFVRLFVC